MTGDLVFYCYILLAKTFPFIAPTRDKVRRDEKEVTSHLCYPYAHFWLWGGIKMKTRYPNCPFLFMYGKRKNIMFHNEATIQKINEDDNASWRDFKGGHWFFDEEPEEVADEIKKFLKKHKCTSVTSTNGRSPNSGIK